MRKGARAQSRPPRAPGIDVKPGTVRQARAAAGLSLAQLAAGDLSRNAIHLIETGRARPSIRTLRLIATRTQKPIEYFVASAVESESDGQVSSLEQLVLEERFDEAVVRANDLIGRSSSGRAEAEGSYFKGRALFRLGRAEASEEALNRAVELYSQIGDRWGAVEARHYLAKALFLREDPSALATAKAALAECRSLQPVPAATEAGLLEAISAIHLTRREWQEAIDAYELSRAPADSLRDLGHLGQMYDNLSLAYQQLGEFGKAYDCSRRALALSRVERDRHAIFRLENNLGVLLTTTGRLDEAEPHLLEALRMSEDLHIEHGRAHVFISLGELYVARGDRAVADGFLQQAAALAGQHGERLTQATAHEVLANSALLERDYDEAERQFGAALALLLTQGDAAARLRSCRVAYARMLRRSGQLEKALDQWESLDGVAPDGHAREAAAFLMVG